MIDARNPVPPERDYGTRLCRDGWRQNSRQRVPGRCRRGQGQESGGGERETAVPSLQCPPADNLQYREEVKGSLK